MNHAGDFGFSIEGQLSGAIDPQDIDPDTGRPYANYSSPALDTSFHDHEMDVELSPEQEFINELATVSNSLADWAAAQVGYGATVDELVASLREAAAKAGR